MPAASRMTDRSVKAHRNGPHPGTLFRGVLLVRPPAQRAAEEGDRTDLQVEVVGNVIRVHNGRKIDANDLDGVSTSGTCDTQSNFTSQSGYDSATSTTHAPDP